ncbi:hypothetical protein AWB69_06480 [Caballeronia udeis]|uniref:Uncharacterized protein n=1 Tax=Caballeronia udeis TaxID=1232866 RepID=A0A158IQZ0_9BURK|nr:hypothetical protein AWB69_06480 [Caballeronia udeis]
MLANDNEEEREDEARRITGRTQGRLALSVNSFSHTDSTSEPRFSASVTLGARGAWKRAEPRAAICVTERTAHRFLRKYRWVPLAVWKP